MVHILSEKFKRWLCTIFLLLWHIEVIDEDSVLLANWWSENTLTPLIKLLV